MDAVLGIDIAKAKFQVSLRWPDGRRRRKSCANTPCGCRGTARVAAASGDRPCPRGARSDGHVR